MSAQAHLKRCNESLPESRDSGLALIHAAVVVCSARWALTECEQQLVLHCAVHGLDRELNARQLRLSLSGYKKRVERTLQKAGVDNMGELLVRLLHTVASAGTSAPG